MEMFCNKINKKTMTFLICILFFVLFSAACNDEADEEMKMDIEDCLTIYSDSLCTKELTGNDTITASIDSYVRLYVKSSYNEAFVIYDKSDIKVECIGEGIYLCTPISRGAKSIIFVEGKQLKYINFKIKGYSESYYIVGNSYVVDVPESKEVSTEILHMLSKYLPQEGNLLDLNYDDLQSGTFEYLPSSQSGTFVISEDKKFRLLGSEIDMSFTLQSIESASSPYKTFTLEQDLTDAFKKLYPQIIIETVIMTATAQRISKSYYY